MILYKYFVCVWILDDLLEDSGISIHNGSKTNESPIRSSRIASTLLNEAHLNKL